MKGLRNSGFEASLTARSNRAGSDYLAPECVARDFSLMREAGVNTVRVYTAPPIYLLDCFFVDRRLVSRRASDY
jgi:hypothetical protein